VRQLGVRPLGLLAGDGRPLCPGMNYIPRKMLHTNHLQMRNNEEMRKAVDAIFYDGLGKTFFKTDER